MTAKKTYDPELIMKIWEVFPDAFSTSKIAPITELYPGRYGVEEITTGQETVVLAECIAATANAISRGGADMDRAFQYIESYAPAYVQRREIRNFLKR